jgi:hypothetical protein
LDNLNGDRIKFQSKKNLQWLDSLLYAIDVVKGAIEQLIVFRTAQLYNRYSVIVVGRTDIKLIFVMSHGSSSNAKKGVQDLSKRIQE